MKTLLNLSEVQSILRIIYFNDRINEIKYNYINTEYLLIFTSYIYCLEAF